MYNKSGKSNGGGSAVNRRQISAVFILIFCFAFTSFFGKSTGQRYLSKAENGIGKITAGIDDADNVADTIEVQSVNDVVSRANETVTMRDIADFLQDKKAHYPLSDEFIERYQQTSGGYLDYAKQTGIEVDKQKHEPNQKWHFFDSWLYRSIDDGSITWEASAKTRVYTGLLCPELLLWIYEACGVDPVKVKAAKEVAEQGKSAKTNVSTIAKNMRACVPWEDLENAILNRESIAPEKLSALTDEVLLVAGNQKDLNDIVKLKFEPENTTNKRVVWSCEENGAFTLNGSKITAIKAGSAAVTATSAEDPSLSVNVTVTVREPNRYSVSVQSGEGYTVTGLESEYAEGSEAVFTVNVTDSAKAVKEVKANDTVLKSVGGTTYKFTMPNSPVVISVALKDKPTYTSAKYELSGVSTAQIKTNEAALEVFKLVEGDGIIGSVNQIDYIYGGGSGGSGDNRWSSTEMMKFGTASVNGSITLTLNSEVNRVIITGFVHDNKCEIRVGDSNSTDWTDEAGDSKTAVHVCSDMNVASKENVDGKNTSTIVIDFESTASLKIANINSTSKKYQLYITSIEFVFCTDTAQ